MSVTLIADNGSTKCSWCLLNNGKSTRISTEGLSPYFHTNEEIEATLRRRLLTKLKGVTIDHVYFFGTGLADLNYRTMMRSLLKRVFPGAGLVVDTDLTGAAIATCGVSKGMISILGTGSGCAYFSGKKLNKIQDGLGFILGDEGSGAYLGRKVLQHYLYNTFDDELMHRFILKFEPDRQAILKSVYHGDRPNRYIAGYSRFLAENRGHYMVENILEDSLNDFINQHIYKFREAWTTPLHFVGSIAYVYKDVLMELCDNYELELGTILKNPIDGLEKFYQSH